MTQALTPIYLNPELGELALLPPSSIIDIAGTNGPTFTVGGRPLLFADGSATDGGPGVNLRPSLQDVYNASIPAVIELYPGNDLTINSLLGGFQINSTTGEVIIVGNLEVGTVNGIDLQDFADHLNRDLPARHWADQISVDETPLINLQGSNVQEIIESIDTRIGSGGAGGVVGIEYVQATAETIWVIQHNKNSERVHVTVWDPMNEMLFADAVRIINADNITITFNTPEMGRAILMIF